MKKEKVIRKPYLYIGKTDGVADFIYVPKKGHFVWLYNLRKRQGGLKRTYDEAVAWGKAYQAGYDEARRQYSKIPR